MSFVMLMPLAMPATAQAAAFKCPNNGIEIGIPILPVSGISTVTDPPGDPSGVKHTCVANDPKTGGAIVVYLKAILQYLSGAVGLVVVLMLVIAGIQYITSVGDPGRIKSAKDRITNAIIALALFIFGFAILSFIIPGGILG
jgi:hypothetical protein